VILRDLVVSDVKSARQLVLVENCNDVLIDGIVMPGDRKSLTSIAKFRISDDETFSSVKITGIVASTPNVPSLILENLSNRGRLIGQESAAGPQTVTPSVRDGRTGG